MVRNACRHNRKKEDSNCKNKTQRNISNHIYDDSKRTLGGKELKSPRRSLVHQDCTRSSQITIRLVFLESATTALRRRRSLPILCGESTRVLQGRLPLGFLLSPFMSKSTRAAAATSVVFSGLLSRPSSG